MNSKTRMPLSFLLVIVSAPFCHAQEYPVAPRDEHKRLQANVGDWDADISIWMQDPDAEPMKSKGVETVKMFGQLWNVTDFEYEYMGAPAQGHGLMGFDPSKKKYVGTWHESGSPYPSTMEGEYNEETKKFTFLMKGRDASGNEQDMKMITWHTDKNHRTFQMYIKMPGSEDFVRTLEIKYTKK